MILVPDLQIFETAFLARNKGIDHPALNLFTSAWSHSVDKREKILLISQELNDYLIENRYKSEKKKRMALFSIVGVHNEKFNIGIIDSLLKLAAILSIETDKDIYLVTDNESYHKLISDEDGMLFEAITSSEAIEKIEKLNK